MKRMAVGLVAMVLLVGMLLGAVADEAFDAALIADMKKLYEEYQAAPGDFSEAKLVVAYSDYQMFVNAKTKETAQIYLMSQDNSAADLFKPIMNAFYAVADEIHTAYGKWLNGMLSNGEFGAKLMEAIKIELDGSM